MENMEVKNKEFKEKRIDIDIMRLVAAYFVIVIHVTSLSSVSQIVYNSFSRFSVPLFIVISGYFMLNRKNDFRNIAKKSCQLMGIMIVCSALHYALFLITKQIAVLSPIETIQYLLTEPPHLWYIYAIVTLYLLTPLLQVFTSHATKQEYIYALIITFVFGSIVKIAMNSGEFSFLETIIAQMKIPYTIGFIFLYLAGGFLGRFKIKHPSWFWGWLCVGSAITIAGTLLLVKYTEHDNLLVSFFAPGTIIAGIAMFVIIENLYKKRPIKKPLILKIIRITASCTFGIYLIHPIVISSIYVFGIFSQEFWSIIPIKALLVFGISLVIIFVVKKIKSLIIK